MIDELLEELINTVDDRNRVEAKRMNEWNYFNHSDDEAYEVALNIIQARIDAVKLKIKELVNDQ